MVRKSCKPVLLIFRFFGIHFFQQKFQQSQLKPIQWWNSLAWLLGKPSKVSTFLASQFKENGSVSSVAAKTRFFDIKTNTWVVLNFIWKDATKMRSFDQGSRIFENTWKVSSTTYTHLPYEVICSIYWYIASFRLTCWFLFTQNNLKSHILHGKFEDPQRNQMSPEIQAQLPCFKGTNSGIREGL